MHFAFITNIYFLPSSLLNILYDSFQTLQPENLLLDSYGNLKVSDFGLSAFSKQIRVGCLVPVVI